jgi:hypothetical protein
MLVLAAGCGSSGAADPTIVPLGSWDREYAAVNCARIFSCCDAAERTARWELASEADCRRQLLQGGGSYVRDVRAGFIVYDPHAARRCIDEIAAAPCAVAFNSHDLRPVLPSCEVFALGARKLGEDCQSLDMYCESGNCSDFNVCGPPRACPTWCGAGLYCDEIAGCLPGKPAGAACAIELECESLTCGATTCEAKRPDGAACSNDENCVSGACSRPWNGTGTCGPPLPDGAACYTDAGCASGTCVFRSLHSFAPACGPPFCDGA